MITSRNQIFLRNHLPKNLSKDESTKYWEGTGFFVLPDSISSEGSNQKDITNESRWTKASAVVEKEYLQFFALVSDYDREYAIVAKKTLIDAILKKYQMNSR